MDDTMSLKAAVLQVNGIIMDRIDAIVAEQCAPVVLPEEVTIDNYHEVLGTIRRFGTKLDSKQAAARHFVMKNEHEQIMIDHGFAKIKEGGWSRVK
jgi:hypothetical protein